MKTWTESAPDYWAGYLINGCADNLSDTEIASINNWLNRMGGRVVDAADDPHFRRFDGIGTNCLTYTLCAL